MHVVGYHDGIWLSFSTVVLYHDIHGGCSVQQCFQKKKSEKLVLANDFHHIHHDNLPDVYRILEYVNIV